MSHPPKGTILAPRARWAASRGEVRKVTPPNLPGGADRLGLGGGAVGDDRAKLDDGSVDLLHHPAEGEQVEHALALVLVDHVDEVLAVAHEHDAVARDDELHGGEV